MDSFIYALLEILPVAEEPQNTGEVPVCVNPTANYPLYPQDDTQLSCIAHQTSIKNSYISTCSAPSLLSCTTFGKYEGSYGPSYVRKRNERERKRVKCVNEGYTKLRRHLPQEYVEKRLSKVQTLRAAICYIRHLQEVLSRGQGADPRDVMQEPLSGRYASNGQQKGSSRV
ncbi:achaete-scute homolog 3-like [Xenopus laevis]|uniref:Achaete-scute homolog 3-like n=1 Tax=Xenopus laevis TaxID=8355 RepID=A0A8J0V9E8_XENLA|nr:achaete-scute homolog 3-like [Xenopus laevis]